MLDSKFTAIGVPIDCLGFDGPLQAVERMPESLRNAGISEALGVERFSDLDIRIGKGKDPNTGVIGLSDCQNVTTVLRQKTRELLSKNQRPFFIGGCCTMAVGVMAGMRDHFGSAGIVYVDGHMDIYDGSNSWNGEMGDMPMAIVLGHGPVDAFRPQMGDNPVSPENAYIVGYRDREEARERNSIMPEDISADLNHIDLNEVRKNGFEATGQQIAERLERENMPFYIHLDVDVLDESILPATMYHLPKGMMWEELVALLRPLAASKKLAAVSLGCYDPDMDPGEQLAKDIAAYIGATFNTNSHM